LARAQNIDPARIYWNALCFIVLTEERLAVKESIENSMIEVEVRMMCGVEDLAGLWVIS
jgi:hypothetical protein